jgi:hypothetical protein
MKCNNISIVYGGKIRMENKCKIFDTDLFFKYGGPG